MKTKVVILLVLCTSVLSTECMMAQKASKKSKKDTTTEVVQEATQVEVAADAVPEITEECLINVSLFNESAKNKQYADAVAPWLAVFEACPNANRVIYSRGRDILHWQLSQTTDAAEIDVLRNRLMEMYDKRIKYFGDDARYPTAWILGIKALDYITFFPETKENAYPWLENSVKALGANSELEVLRQFGLLSSLIYQENKEHGEKYIADYLQVGEYLDVIIKDTENTNAETAAQIKNGFDALFVQSGAADCDVLDGLYKIQVEANTQNTDVLNRIVSFYKRTGCTRSEVYFAASEAVHKIQPTAGSANGCAEMAYLRKDFKQAIAYFEESISLSDDNMDKADLYFKIAQIYFSELNNYQAARTNARKSLENNPNQGKPYLLIGNMYAQSKPYDNPVLNKTVFWVAVDQFRKAKQVDASCAEVADQMIATYSRYFPNNEEVFFQPELQAGKTFTVGGWINESTTCR